MIPLLRVYSEYSLLQSNIRAKNAAKFCQENEITAIAITDDNNMFGTMQWSLTLSAANIQPIIGCRLKLTHNQDVWVYCKNEAGYIELANLLSISFIEKNGLLNHNDLLSLKNCILLIDHKFADIANYNHFETVVRNFKQECEQNKIQLGIAISRQINDAPFEPLLFTLSHNLDLPIVAAPRFCYEKPAHKLAVDALLCIKHNTYLAERDREHIIEDGFLLSQTELKAKFSDIPQALENAELIAKLCTFKLETHAPRMPGIKTDKDPVDALKEVLDSGLEYRLQNFVFNEIATSEHEATRKLYQERANYEFEMLKKMGFCEYFLIVSDIVTWSKQNGIPVGPGRGSGASSLVAWCLNITNLNPIKFNLMFERFLNPDRVTLPDFDIDFCQENRHRVIEYIQTRFGKDNVAHIITFGSLQYRAALRDIGRVMQIPYMVVDNLCKKLPPPVLGVAPTLKELRENGISQNFINSETQELFEIAESVEGLPRHSSMHAAGLVIGNQKLANIVPLYKEPESEMPIVQFAMKPAEQIGLVKFDILGLTVLSTLKKACEMIGTDLNLDHIKLDDEKTFKVLQQGLVKGIFQFDTLGFKQFITEMQPTHFEDLIVAGALFRPGPMADIPQFIKCKKNPDQIQYLYPQMEPILKDTYGVIVYQEQVLQIAKEMAGYSLKEADLLRRAMAKKIKSEMALHQEKFINGILEVCKDTKEKAEQLFENLARFSSYGFPKAHAAPYGMMTYQTAYLKAHYPQEFYCATLIYEQIQEKTEEVMQEARKLGVKIQKPCLNKSQANFSLNENKEIVYGLGRIKGVGEIANLIVEEREKNGDFKSIDDFMIRVSPNKKVLENFVYAGVFDAFDTTFDRHNQFAKISNPNDVTVISLFDDAPEIEEWSALEIIKHEFETMHSVFSMQFFNIDLTNFSVNNKISDIKKHGYVFALAIKNNMRKTKDGRTLHSLQFVDANGVQENLMNSEHEIAWEFSILEVEFGSRYVIKKIYKQTEFFSRYKKIFLSAHTKQDEAIIENAIQKLATPDASASSETSLYLENANQEKTFLGDFILDLNFILQINEFIISVH